MSGGAFPQRGGTESQSELIYGPNNLGNQWSGTSVKSKRPNQKFKPVARGGKGEEHLTIEPRTMKESSEFLRHHEGIVSTLR